MNFDPVFPWMGRPARGGPGASARDRRQLQRLHPADGVEGGAGSPGAALTAVAGKWILLGWLCVAPPGAGRRMAWRNARFRQVQRDRVRAGGRLAEPCWNPPAAARVKPVPRIFYDHLPSACLIGVVHPFISRPAGYRRSTCRWCWRMSCVTGARMIPSRASCATSAAWRCTGSTSWRAGRAPQPRGCRNGLS